jgi:hypothetical protein
MILRCGVRPATRTRWPLAVLGDENLRHIGDVCAVDIDVVRAMTLERDATNAADFDNTQDHPEPASWTRRVGSRFCPHCLRETAGRWQLAWRTNWSFTCMRHGCMLADSCPMCRAPQRRNPPYASRIPQPGRCPRLRYSQATRETHPCNADLGTAEVLLMPTQHPALNAQRTLDAILNGGRVDLPLYGGAPPGCDGLLSDLRLLARWAISAIDLSQLECHLPPDLLKALTTHRQFSAWPHGQYWRSAGANPSALDTAAGATLAVSVLTLPDTAMAASVLQQLMGNAKNGGPYRRPIPRRAHLSPTLSLVYGIAQARDNADRKLRSRLARKLATSPSMTAVSRPLAR